MKRALAVAALVVAAAGAAYFAYRYLVARQPAPGSLPAGTPPRTLPATDLSPAPVTIPASVGVAAAAPGSIETSVAVPAEEETPSVAAVEESDDEPELPSAAELEAEESIAEIAQDEEAEAVERAEAVEVPGEVRVETSETELGEADLAEALLEEVPPPVAGEEPPELEADAEAEPDLWSPSAGVLPASADPVLARFEALAATEDVIVESVSYEPAETAEVEIPATERADDDASAEPDAPEAEVSSLELGGESPEAVDVDETEEIEAQPEAEPTPQAQSEAPTARRTDDASAEDTAAADALLDEGNAYFNVGQFSLAIQRYDRAIQLAPRLVAAYYNRANARTRIGDYDGAQADYDTALGLNPTDADALNNRGMLHLYRGNHNAALQDFNLALGIDSRDGTVIVNRGLAYLHKGDARAALSDFHEAIRLDSRDGAAHYGAAQSLATLGDSNAALMSLRNALRIEPSYAREAAAEPRFASLQSNDEFTRLLRNPNG